MNVVFLTLGKLTNINHRGIYSDLLREFKKQGHNIYIVTPNERRNGGGTEFFEQSGVHILRVKTGNITKCGLIEKGISTLLIEGQFVHAIKKHFSNVKFDLILYSTPPITFLKAVQFIKKRDNAKTYLLLKDIFPQNAVDLGIMSKRGLKGVLYRFFRRKEKKLYAISDRIGCMSQANCDYVLQHNPHVDESTVEVCPNSIEFIENTLTEFEKREVREKYNLPIDRKIFVYGGNLGRPQGIDHIIDCLQSQKNNETSFFLIVGSGTEYRKLAAFFEKEKPNNMKLMPSIPREEYDSMIAACDIGLIFLDYRFTIPNFPSRLLSYMQAKMPILACTDQNTDIGKVITEGGFGWWCQSDDVKAFGECVNVAASNDLSPMGKKAQEYLLKYYSVKRCYQIIIKGLFCDN